VGVRGENQGEGTIPIEYDMKGCYFSTVGVAVG